MPNALRRNASERSDVRALGWCTDASRSAVCDRPRARNENDWVSARSNTVILALTFGCLVETSSEASLLSAEYTRQATGPRVRMCISGATGEPDATSSIYGEFMQRGPMLWTIAKEAAAAHKPFSQRVIGLGLKKPKLMKPMMKVFHCTPFVTGTKVS